MIMLGCGQASGANVDDLYQGQTIVTGQVEEARRLGFPVCLDQVLVKVSGDPRLIGDPEVLLAGQAATVTDYAFAIVWQAYPSMTSRARDRPYDLTVRFDPAKIDAALRSLGREPWRRVTPTRHSVRWRGSRRGDLPARERRQARTRPARSARGGSGAVRHADCAADQGGAGGRGLELQALDLASLDATAKAIGGDLALAGTLLWSEQALGWVADWRMDAGGRAIDGRSAASTSMTRFAAPCPALRRSSATGSRTKPSHDRGERDQDLVVGSWRYGLSSAARFCWGVVDFGFRSLLCNLEA